VADGNGESGVVIERRSGGGLGVFVLGVAVGAGLALLFAPQAGEDTRATLARGARKARRKARRYLDSARDSAAETREALEQRLARHHEAEDGFDGEDHGV
jgi:gas vesicle protein